MNLGSNNEVKLGRGHESDIRISDISVSRVHASLRFMNGKFYIKDLDAKFGTLKAFKDPIKLEKNLTLQVGRTLINLEKQRKPITCCS